MMLYIVLVISKKRKSMKKIKLLATIVVLVVATFATVSCAELDNFNEGYNYGKSLWSVDN